MTRAPNPLLRFRLPGVLLLIVLVYGSLGYVLIERWDWFDSVYMTLTTIATVGYGEVHPLSAAGRTFTMTLIVGGVGTMLYAFGVFAQVLTDEEVVKFRRRRQVERRLQTLKDHFIVCGYGRIGTQIVQEFVDQKVGYVVIENNPEAHGRLRRDERLFVEGDAASEAMLEAAGIERARGLVSATDSDERGVYIVLAARALNPRLYIIARAGQPDSIRRLELAGADRVISPYRMAGHRMAELALRPAVADVLDTLRHGESDVGLEELIVPSACPAIGKGLEEAGLLSPSGARLLALRRKDGSLHVNPDGSLQLQEGDLLVALGSEEQLLSTAARLQ